MIGEVVGSYRIQSKLGEGGMGIVWTAEHVTLGRRVAMKMLLPELSANHEMVSRFFTEARTAASIEHPGMVDVYDFGHHTNGCAFIVMQYLEGETLTRYLLRGGGRLRADIVMALGRQIASAVGAAHQKGIVHRDLKPDNIYLVPDAEIAIGMRAKVLDFGIAKLSENAAPGTLRTRTGVIMGTPVYMSPEQCRGAGAVDSRADIYSMGCILYQLVCGHPPFVAEGAGEIIAAQLYAEPQPLASLVPEIPRELDTIVARCLAKLPKDRPQTMEEVAIGLGGTLSHPPVGPKSFPIISVRTSHTLSAPGKRNLLIGGAVAALAVIGGIAAATLGGRSPAAEVAAAAAPEPAPTPPPDVKPLVAPEPAPVAPAAPVAPEPAPAPPPPIPAAAPLPTTINLKLVSDPAGAEIYRAADGIKLGVTPLDQQMQRSEGFAVFIVKLAGYEDARIELPADKDGEMAVSLTKIVAAAPRVTRNVKRTDQPAAAPVKPAAKHDAINDGALDPFAK